MLIGFIWRLVGMLETNMKQLLSLYSSLPPLHVSCSESVLELSIMPKDEDVLQLVSVFSFVVISEHCRKLLILAVRACRVQPRFTRSSSKNVKKF